MTRTRLPIAFLVALCGTTALFWLLAAMTSVGPRVSNLIIGCTTVRSASFTVFCPVGLPESGPRLDPSKQSAPAPAIPAIQVAAPSALEALDPVDRDPLPVLQPEPDYPLAARERSIEGWATAQLTVAVDGSVKDVAIVESEPPQVWDAAMIHALSAWRYQPALEDGQPVERTVDVTHRFEL